MEEVLGRMGVVVLRVWVDGEVALRIWGETRTRLSGPFDGGEAGEAEMMAQRESRKGTRMRFGTCMMQVGGFGWD